MANQNLFHAGKMASQDVRTYLAGAIVLDGSDEPIEAPDGGLVDLGGLHEDTTYSATGLEYDVYDAKAPTASYKDLALIDYAGVSQGEIGGNEYKVGIKLYGLKVPAGQVTRVRRPGLHDKFWLGAANFAEKPAIGDAFGVNAGEFTHAKIAAGDVDTHTGYMIRVRIARELTTGMRSQGQMYLAEVVQL